jgi:hypothetical protein
MPAGALYWLRHASAREQASLHFAHPCAVDDRRHGLSRISFEIATKVALCQLDRIGGIALFDLPRRVSGDKLRVSTDALPSLHIAADLKRRSVQRYHLAGRRTAG